MDTSKFDFYNPEIKAEFLEQYNDDTALIYAYSLSKSREEEEFYGKDLYEFNVDQLSKVFPKFMSCNMNSIKKHSFIIGMYQNWAVEKGYTHSNISALSGMDNEWYERFVMNKKMFINMEELCEFEDLLVNYQDKLMLRLPFEGIMGYESSMMRNLNKNSFNNINNKITVKDDKKGDLTREVSDRCIDMIRKAYAEEVYYLKNGESEGHMTEAILPRNDYVLRINSRKGRENERLEPHNLHRRLTLIKKAIELPSITFKSLEKSGMIYFAKELYLQRGKLDKEEYDLIGDTYNLTKLRANGHEYHNSTLMKTYINRKNILELYGIDINK